MADAEQKPRQAASSFQAGLAQRRAEALALRRKGHTYREIGEALGIDFTIAYRDVQDMLAETRALAAEDAQAIREIEIARLDAQLKALSPKVDEGEPRSIEVALKVAERRAKLLGLDAPTKQEVSGPDGGAIPIDDARAMLAAKLATLASGTEPGATQGSSSEPT